MYIQWNLFKKDTAGTKESVLILIWEVSSFQWEKCTPFGLVNLEPLEVSLWERCYCLRGVLYEEFHCTPNTHTHKNTHKHTHTHQTHAHQTHTHIHTPNTHTHTQHTHHLLFENADQPHVDLSGVVWSHLTSHAASVTQQWGTVCSQQHTVSRERTAFLQ